MSETPGKKLPSEALTKLGLGTQSPWVNSQELLGKPPSHALLNEDNSIPLLDLQLVNI